MSGSEEEYFFKERRERLEYNRPFDADNWAFVLKEHTFPTFCFVLSQKDAEALTFFYRVKVLGSKTLKYTEEHEKCVESIKGRIDDTMKQNKAPDGWFVRLSTRSPKDACLFDEPGKRLKCVEKTKDRLYTKLKLLGKLKNTDPRDNLSNQEYVALMEAACESLCCESADDAMELLTHSERSYVDLMLHLDFKDEYEKYPMQVILRAWSGNLAYHNEFRGFVHGAKLNALTQYDNFCYFPQLQSQKEAIGEKICKFFETTVQPLLSAAKFEHYVADFGILDSGQCIVIELNPFDHDSNTNKQGTGSGCFSWEKDRQVLKNGPFEFRITESPPFTDLDSQVAPDWMKFIKHARRRLLKDGDGEQQQQLEQRVSESICCIS